MFVRVRRVAQRLGDLIHANFNEVTSFDALQEVSNFVSRQAGLFSCLNIIMSNRFAYSCVYCLVYGFFSYTVLNELLHYVPVISNVSC